MRTGVTVVVSLGVLAGCSSSTAGQPVTAGAGSTSSPTAQALPERPRSFDLTTVDPCTLMPEARRPEFNLDQVPIGPGPVDGNEQLIKCSISSTTESSFSAFLDTSGGAAERLSQARPDAVLRSIDVNGFAIPLLAGGDGSSCIAVVDVTDKQNMRIQANSTGRLTPEQACDVVEPWVQVVMDTLAELQPT